MIESQPMSMPPKYLLLRSTMWLETSDIVPMRYSTEDSELSRRDGIRLQDRVYRYQFNRITFWKRRPSNMSVIVARKISQVGSAQPGDPSQNEHSEH